MNTRQFSQALGQIDERYIEEATRYQGKAAGRGRLRWAAVAACAAVLLAAGLMWSGLTGGRADTATLANGTQITFSRAQAIGGTQIDGDVVTQALTQEETAALFGMLPVTASAVYSAAEPQTLLGFQGTLGEVQMVIAVAEEALVDTQIAAEQTVSQVDGVAVSAGYFLTDANSRGERSAVYFAAFTIGGSRVYMEYSLDAEARETAKDTLAQAVQQLIANGEPDLSAFG